ncbi:zinc transporter ZIP13 homolog [Planococcus citri]|uniref:zinc transporter ZIP13 homolog n=1 Tax=Planococcus citri TaxID=170843 RepID=UPI0031F7F1BB
MSISEELLYVYNETTANNNVDMNTYFWHSYDKLWDSYAPLPISSAVLVDYQPWIMSLLGSVLVGLSGILPLLVIPLEDTATLKTGTGAKTLRVLLSFAVGGLLGDVFLHLLPEAWGNQYSPSSTTSKTNQPSLTCGLWVLAGLLAFIIIEKMFSFEKDNEEEEGETLEADCDFENEKNAVKKSLSIRRKKSSFILNDLTAEIIKPLINGTIANNNNNNNNNNDNLEKSRPLEKKPSNIHVSGYLNLMANSIDNFTHGLAVGGSFLLSTRVGVFTTFAILVHEIPHEVGDFAILLRAGFSRWDAACAQIYTASAGILGAVTALAFSASASAVEARTSWILPFTAGGFLHIALVTVLPELLDEKNPKESLKQMCSLASGITVMALLTTLIEG